MFRTYRLDHVGRSRPRNCCHAPFCRERARRDFRLLCAAGLCFAGHWHPARHCAHREERVGLLFLCRTRTRAAALFAPEATFLFQIDPEERKVPRLHHIIQKHVQLAWPGGRRSWSQRVTRMRESSVVWWRWSGEENNPRYGQQDQTKRQEMAMQD